MNSSRKRRKNFTVYLMKVFDFILLLSKYVPELPITSKNSEKIKKITNKVSPKRYASACIVVSATVGLPITFIYLPAGLVCFGIVFYFLLNLPKIELEKEAKEIESELPFFIREVGFLVDVGLPFENAIDVASGEKNRISKKIQSAIEEMRSGSTFQMAISRIAIESESMQVKRAFSALISSYEHGGTTNLEKISDELLMVQRHEIKDSSSKIAVYGLIFMAFSSVAPTFFIIYSILGESLFQNNVSLSSFAVIMVLIFPAIDILILLVASSFIPKQEIKERFELNPLRFYEKQKRNEELEKFLPDALLTISSVPAGSSTETAISAVSKGGYGVLSSEFGISLKQLRSKISIKKVLEDLSARNDSAMMSKAANMLSNLFATNHFQMASKLAEDFIAEHEISRERANAFSMQKYTLFFGAVIIPIILSTTISISSKMAELMERNTTDFSIFIQIYLLIYCGMTAYFSASMENKKSMAIIYFISLSVLSLLTFNIIKVVW